MITNEPLEFDSEDQILWRQFLLSRAGARLLPKLADSAPQLLHGGNTNEILIANGKLLGFQMALAALLALAYPPQTSKEYALTYPALDDDAAWNDGNTLTKPPTP